MDFIIDAIVEWLKGLLVDGIMGKSDGLFDNVNQSVGEIATLRRHDPQLNTAVLEAYEAKLEQMAERGSVGRASISDQLKAGKAAAEQAKAERPPKEKPSRSAGVDLGPCWPEAERRRKPCHANGRTMTRPAITTENCWAAVPKRTAMPIPLLMNACGAAHMSCGNMPIFPELKAILEKAKSAHAGRLSRTGGMFHAPKSPRGARCRIVKTLCPGCFWYLPPATAERWWQMR